MRYPAVFLPGIIAPAAIRYGPLVERLSDVDVVVRDLAVYDGDEPPPDFSIDTELVALDHAADEAGFDAFHLCGHSGGGAVALAYAASRGGRLRSVAVDEPASDFTEAGDAVYGWPEFDAALLLPPAESTAAFMRLQVADDVILPPPPAGDPPAWMAKRPAGIRAYVGALRRHRVEPSEYAAFAAPVRQPARASPQPGIVGHRPGITQHPWRRHRLWRPGRQDSAATLRPGRPAGHAADPTTGHRTWRPDSAHRPPH